MRVTYPGKVLQRVLAWVINLFLVSALVATFSAASGMWLVLPCNPDGSPLAYPAYDSGGYLSMTGPVTGTSSDTYPAAIEQAAAIDPSDYEQYFAFAEGDGIFYPNQYMGESYLFPPYPNAPTGTGISQMMRAFNYAGAVNAGYYSIQPTPQYPGLPTASGFINGSVTTHLSGQLQAYFKWAYIDAYGQLATPPTGSSPPQDAGFLVKTQLGVSLFDSSEAASIPADLTATAAVSDGMGTALNLNWNSPAAMPAPSATGLHFVQPPADANGVMAVQVNGTVDATATNNVPWGQMQSQQEYTYPVKTNGQTMLQMTPSLTAAVKPFTSGLQAAATGQPLSASPAYFAGIACQAHAACPALAGSVSHAQLLVDGTVVAEYWDTAASGLPSPLPSYAASGTNQAGAPLSATFDATSFTEGYKLVVTMKVWDTQGNAYSAKLSAPVHLPTLAAYVVWTPDDTLPAPIPQAATQSGQIGGNATVHVRLLYPPGGSGATLDSLTIHEAYGDTADLVTSHAAMTGTANPLCGDPSGATAPPACYLDVPWNIGGHNGGYAVTPLLTWTGKASVAPGAASVTHSLSPAITVDREDLLITSTAPANPTPLKWDPTANLDANGNPAPLSVSAPIVSACKANGIATLDIYTPNQTRIRTIIVQPFTTTDGQVTFSWDGRADAPSDAQGNPVLDASGNPVPGVMQPKGVYLFQIMVWAPPYSHVPEDSDKSDNLYSLSAPSPGALYTLYDTTDPANNLMVFAVKYHLNDDFSAGEGRIELYDPLLNKVDLYKPYTKPAPPLMLQGTDLTPGDHTINVGVPTSMAGALGTYTFLVSIRDHLASQDRGHRNRWALSIGNYFTFKKVSLMAPDDTTPMLFRGQPTPCPVLLKGVVSEPNGALTPKMLYTYTKGYYDAQGNWQIVDKEAVVPSGQITNEQVTTQMVNGQSNFAFQATWNQQLKRTLVVPNKEYYKVSAYAIENNPESSPQDRRIRVFTMAYPVQSETVSPNGGYHEVNRTIDANYLSTFALTDGNANGVAANLPIEVRAYNGGNTGPHLAVDLEANAGETINAAEYGSISDNIATFTPLNGQGGFNQAIADEIASAMQQWAAVHPIAILSGGTVDATNNLGPNRQVQHDPMNLLLDSTQPSLYDQQVVTTLYCHLQAQSDGITPVNPQDYLNPADISDPVAVVGDWYSAGISQQSYSQNPSWLLARGYLTDTGATIYLVSQADVSQDGTFDPSKILARWDGQTVYIPSITGPHLHFEVRVESEHDDIHPHGQKNPNDWLYLSFGAKN